MSKEKKQVALAFIQAMSDGDAEAMAQCTTNDVFTHTRGFGKVSGTRDRETMLATTSAFREVIPTGFRHKMVSVTAEAERVVVEFEGNAVLSNGEEYCNQYVFVFTFRDDKIKQLNEYFCTVLADKKILPLLVQQGPELARGN